MDPVTLAIIAAITAGATTGVTDVAKKAMVDAYEGLKGLLKKKFGSHAEVSDAIDKLQARPDSPGRREMLAEELKAVNAAADPEILREAELLLKLIQALPQGEQHVQTARGTGIAQADRGSVASVNVFGPPQRKNDG